MKKIILLLCLIIFTALQSFADVTPYSINDINPLSLGVYQAENKIKIYKEPNENSEILLEVYWNANGLNSSKISANSLFTAFYPKKDLAFLTVTDESEDMEWLQIVYNHNKYGWIKKEDPYRYSNWRNFINDYGRKYGMKYLKGAPEASKNLYGSPDEASKIISSIKLAKAIKLTSVSGNWFLAIIYDIDHQQKIGWLNWRNTDGTIFMFPLIH